MPKSKLKEETLSQWNALVQVPLEKSNAASVGAATGRPRMVSTNITAVKEVRRKPAADPNIFLESGKTESRTMPCVMTCPRATWNPLKVTDKQTYQERFATPDELLKLMGYQLGSLKSATSDREKEKMLGNAFHYQLIRSLVVGERQIKAPTLLIRSRHTSATLCGGCVVGCGQSVVASHTWPAPWLQGPATKLWHHSLTTKPATFLVGLWCKCGGCVGQLCGGVVVGLWACTPPHPPHTIATPALPHSSCFRPPHFMFNVSPPPHPTPRTH